MFPLVSKFKIIGMLLSVVHSQVQNSEQKHTSKESNGFHNRSTLITMPILYSFVYSFVLYVFFSHTTYCGGNFGQNEL